MDHSPTHQHKPSHETSTSPPGILSAESRHSYDPLLLQATQMVARQLSQLLCGRFHVDGKSIDGSYMMLERD